MGSGIWQDSSTRVLEPRRSGSRVSASLEPLLAPQPHTHTARRRFAAHAGPEHSQVPGALLGAGAGDTEKHEKQACPRGARVWWGDRFVNKWLQRGGRVYGALSGEGSDGICQEPVAGPSACSLSADEVGAEPALPVPVSPRGVCARLCGAPRARRREGPSPRSPRSTARGSPCTQRVCMLCSRGRSRLRRSQDDETRSQPWSREDMDRQTKHTVSPWTVSFPRKAFWGCREEGAIT